MINIVRLTMDHMTTSMQQQRWLINLDINKTKLTKTVLVCLFRVRLCLLRDTGCAFTSLDSLSWLELVLITSILYLLLSNRPFSVPEAVFSPSLVSSHDHWEPDKLVEGNPVACTPSVIQGRGLGRI